MRKDEFKLFVKNYTNYEFGNKIIILELIILELK